MQKAMPWRLTTKEAGGGGNQPARATVAMLDRKCSFFHFVIEVAERCDGALLNGPAHRYEFEQLPDFHVQCSGPDCHAGGVSVAPLFQEMLGDHETERLVMEMCPGRVPFTNKKTVYVKCQGMFFIRLHCVRRGAA